ncbi:MAG TPA: hypothetical protein VF723_10780 [Pyrinomonadaceae bacterium]|jgi:hypothetical protein
MAVKEESHHEHNPVLTSDETPAEMAARLAPPEERAGKGDGVISVDTGEFRLPKEFTEKDDDSWRFFGLAPIAAIILVLSLAFIAFIAYLISTAPPAP